MHAGPTLASAKSTEARIMTAADGASAGRPSSGTERSTTASISGWIM